MSYESRVALVTGAGHGIGAGIADRLAGQGHRLVLVDRNADTLAESRERIVAAGGTALAIEADVADAAAMTAVVERVAGEVGPVEILVNNAGFARDHPISELGLDDWDAVNDVVLRAAFCTHQGRRAEHEGEALGPDLVNISSISALNDDGRANYVAAKAGLNGLTKAAALELGPFGITVNAVAPGVVVTGMTEIGARRQNRTLDEHVAILAEHVLVGRVGHPPRHRTRGYLLHRRGRGLHHRADLVRVRLPARVRPRPARFRPPGSGRIGSRPVDAVQQQVVDGNGDRILRRRLADDPQQACEPAGDLDPHVVDIAGYSRSGSPPHTWYIVAAGVSVSVGSVTSRRKAG